MVIQTSIIHRQGCHWISNRKTRGTGPLVDPMSNQSSLSRYGKTATRTVTSQGFFMVSAMRLEVANQAAMVESDKMCNVSNSVIGQPLYPIVCILHIS